MCSIFYINRLFPINKIAIGSTNPLAFLRGNQLLLTPIASKGSINLQRFTVSSLAYSSGLHLETASKPSTSQNSSDKDSYTVSYLINSCGLSPETAISASKNVHFETPERPNSVLTLLRNHGFSKTQIANLVRKRPVLLSSSPESTLLPKLEFFQSIGASRTDLARTISKDPTVLTRSLENQIIPSYNFLKSVLRSNEKVVAAMRRTSWIFLDDLAKNLGPNIALLREIGVPESCIILLLAHYPEALIPKLDQFLETVTEVKKMGFDPSKSLFVLAVHAISGKGGKSRWNRCYEAYGKWGWSKDDILLAFRKHPTCMILSGKKISGAMDFLVNKMGWQSVAISRYPWVLFFSLEKRIIPRCTVIRVLSLKRLLKKDVSLTSVLVSVEKDFLKKFVIKYKKEVPQLLGVYQGKVGFLEV
ncbi:unnamed protein product [Ilex paraguariensis]|uniref:Uncharacterized protein n=1 Tax=Ilex paraguariensis TaxID=185542 RepID=A0ABC8U8H5_9AQUA